MKPKVGDRVKVTWPGKCRFFGTVTFVSLVMADVVREDDLSETAWPFDQIEVVDDES